MTIKGVVFDLDDTLYLERDYVRSGFWHVAQRFAGPYGPTHLFASMWESFESGQRGDVFDRILETYPDVPAGVPELIQAYRHHEPDIQMLGCADELLDRLACRRVNLGLISDGPLESQRTKMVALGLEPRLKPALLTDRWGREFWKPHPHAFELIARAWGLAGSEIAYVADNPSKDFLAPKRLGWYSVRLRMPGQLHFALDASSSENAPDVEVLSLGAIASLVG